MKLTATTTSTSLEELLETAEPGVLEIIESKRIQNEKIWNFRVEIMFAWGENDELNVELILNTADGDSRPVNASNPVFAFECMHLRDVQIYGSSDFYVSIY